MKNKGEDREIVFAEGRTLVMDRSDFHVNPNAKQTIEVKEKNDN